jgi:hypothetical protein
VKEHDYNLPAAADPIISNIIAQVSPTDLYDFVTYLMDEKRKKRGMLQYYKNKEKEKKTKKKRLKDSRYLTGEASTIQTRQAQSTGALSAQNYLELQFVTYLFSFLSPFFKNLNFF